MKIAILTIDKVYNYGAALQSYALFDYLSSLSDFVEVIEFDKRPQFKVSSCESINVILSPLWKYLTDFKAYFINVYKFRDPGLRKLNYKKALFRSFWGSKLRFSKRTGWKNLNQILQRYDIVVVGSDQVWNPELIFDTRPFLLDGLDDRVRAISYAASFGISEIENYSLRTVYSESLKNFHRIGVRERSALKLLSRLGLDSAELNLDPVFLKDRRFWDEMIGERERVSEPDYCLGYGLGNDVVNVDRCLLSLKNTYALECKKIGRRAEDDELLGIEVCWEVGPVEFVSLIRASRAVVTNSFHAICFSLIYDKPLIVVIDPTNNRNSRIVDLLDDLGLSALLGNQISNGSDSLRLKKPSEIADYRESLSRKLVKSQEFIDTCIFENCVR